MYGVEWMPPGATFRVDGRVIGSIARVPDYPMQLMLGLYELPAFLADGGRLGPWPKSVEVDWVRGWRPLSFTGPT